MKLKLTDTYGIETDDRNVSLVKYKIAKETQKEYSVAIGHYSSFEKAISGALFNGLKLAEIEGLNEIVSYIKDFETKIIESLASLHLK